MAIAVELGVDLAGAVYAQILGMHVLDLFGQLGVAHRPRRQLSAYNGRCQRQR